MKNLDELRKILRAQKPLPYAEYGIQSIGIFGSVIRHEQQNESAVDILVAFDKAIDLLTFVHLKNHLSDLLQVNVDLVMKKALKENNGQLVLKEVVYI